MCGLWIEFEKTYHSIPIGSLDRSHPRLETPGFRWPPRTLTEITTGHQGLMSQFKGEARIHPLGLLVRCGGFVVRQRCWYGPLARNVWDFALSAPRPGFEHDIILDLNSGIFYISKVGRKEAGSYANSQTIRELLGQLDTEHHRLGIVLCETQGLAHKVSVRGVVNEECNGAIALSHSEPAYVSKVDSDLQLCLSTTAKTVEAARATDAARCIDELTGEGPVTKEAIDAATELQHFLDKETERYTRDENIKAAILAKADALEMLTYYARQFFWADLVAESFEATEWMID